MKKRVLIYMMTTLLAGAALSGCGKRAGTETEAQQQTNAPITVQTEAVTEAVGETMAEEKQTETSAVKLIENVDYTSKDASVKITLPDNSWKVTQDTDEMRVFQSGKIAVVNIAHAKSASEMAALSYKTSEEALDKELAGQYTGEDDYEIMSFDTANISGVDTYRYVVKYNANARMWAYAVTYAIVAEDQAYTVTGSVTNEDEKLLEAVKKSVESFRVLNDETLKTVTSEIVSGITTAKPVKTDTTIEAEMKSLTEYGTPVTLITNDAVNVRMEPGTDGEVLNSLERNEQVSVTGETDNWFQVNLDGNVGYIRKDFLVYGTNAETEAQPDTSESYDEDVANAELNGAVNYDSPSTLYASDTVNVRTTPAIGASVIDTLTTGTSVTVVGETDNWFIVSVNGATGYVSKSYLGHSNDGGSSDGGSDEQESGTDLAMTSLSGTVTEAGADTLTIAGDNGQTYMVYYGEASVDGAGVSDGSYVEIALDNTQVTSGVLYAVAVTGY